METENKMISQPSEAKVRNVWTEVPGAGHVAQLVPRASSSALSLNAIQVPANASVTIRPEAQDSVLVLLGGVVETRVADQIRSQSIGDATLLTNGSEAVLTTASAEATVIQFLVEIEHADTHAPLGAGEIFSSIDLSNPQNATSNRSYRIVFGPENGSAHATLFVGLVPVGAAPWHFHQYEEIALILEGKGLFHHDGSATPLSAGSAFHIPARDLHINENTSTTEEVLLLGFLTPAGSPSAAYLPKPH